jgi:hypothetical protein
MYFLRPIMMRHSQEQKYRGTSTTLMSLPPKVNHFVASQKVPLLFLSFSLSNTVILILEYLCRRSGNNWFDLTQKRKKSSEKSKKRHRIGISNFELLI